MFKPIDFLKIFLVIFIMACLIIAVSSCKNGQTSVDGAVKELKLKIPEDAALTVSEIRVRGFTLSWPAPDDGSYEYAIGASYKGAIESYEQAVAYKYIVLPFTSGEELGNTYTVKGLIGGRDYEISLFIRKKDTKAANYLTASAKLPYMDDAEILSLSIDDLATTYDKETDTFTASYLTGAAPDVLTFDCSVPNYCVLYVNGKESNGEDVALDLENQPVKLQVVSEKFNAVRDYELYVNRTSNGIPVVVIDTEKHARVRDTETYIEGTMKIYDGTENPYGTGLYEGPISIKGRGNSSFGMPKKGYTVSFSKDTPVLDMEKSETWALIANYSDKSLMRNYIAFELYRDMGAFFSPDMRFVDFIFNGEYLGTYIIGELPRIDKGRIDIDKLKSDTPQSDISGGYVVEVNSTDKYSRSEIIFETPVVNRKMEHFFSIKQPSEKNISDAAYEYIKNYFNQAEDALYSDHFKDPENGWRKYIDEASVIDWLIVNEAFKQVDAGFHTSVYLYKPRNDKLYMGPVWDFDLGAGNADYFGCDDPEGWYVIYAVWISRFFEDEGFVANFKARWNEVKDDVFKKMYDRIDSTAAMLEKSQQMNFEKWPILGVYVWPNAGDVENRTTYQSEIRYLKDWLAKRIAWMDEEINNNM